MRTIFIFLLIINVIVISVGEDPESAPVTDQSENPISSLEKGVEGLVNIVHSFLKNVQSEDFVGKESGSISFSEVEKIITNSEFDKLGSRWKDLVAVFGGFAASVVVGLLFMLCMPVAGCVTCCCFCCCKRCGKASSKEDPKRAKCKRITFGTLLFIFTILMMVGAIFAVVSNEILHSKLQNVNEQGLVGEIQSGVDGLVDFAESTADGIVDKANKKVDETVGTLLRTIQDATRQVVTDIKNTINATQLLNQVEALGKNANLSAESLSDVSQEVNTLRSLGNDVTNKITSIQIACTGPLNNTCPDITGLSLGPSFSGLNNLSFIHVIVQTVTNISTEASKAKGEFNTVQNKIEKKVNSTIQEAENSTQDMKKEILEELPKLKDTLRNMTTSFNVTNKLNDVDKSLKEYGDYVWYAFVGIPCLILLVVLFYLFGLLFGMFGERPGPEASCCNKGAGSNMFCCGVTCSYLVSSILMLVVIIMFVPFGLLYTNGCQYLNDGVENIERFEFVINESLGYNIAKYIDKDNKSPNITVGSILYNCKKNEGVYDAFHLENLFSIDSILNVSQITNKIDEIVTQGSNIKLENISIIPLGLEEQLNDFSTSGLARINFTQYDDILTVNLVQTDLSALINELNASATAASNAGQTEKAIIIRNQSKEVGNIQDDLQLIELSRRNLSIALDNLRNQQDLRTQVTELIDSLKTSEENFNTKSSTILSDSLEATSTSLKNTVSKSISDIKTEIKTLGPCRDVYDNVQKLSDAFCVTLLDPLNSIWFGLGWGLAFFIPCIIFALLTASLYQREEPYVQSFHTTRKRNKDESESAFDNTNIDMYQGQGYDAYNGQGADNLPLTGMRNEPPGNRDHHRSSGGMPNHGYHSPDYPDHRSSGHPHADYHHGYSKDQSSPPPYNRHSYNDNVSGRAKMYQKPQY